MRLTLYGVIALLLPVLCAAEPQVTNYAPFSGAIYIVNGQGQAFTGGGQNYCPASASVACSSINQPSWCCPNSHTCVSPSNSNGLIGCCPAGSSCSGTIDVSTITTVTVQVQQPPPATTVAPGEFCMTLTMEGPGLPTTKEGQCGTYLIVEEAGESAASFVGYGAGILVLFLHVTLGIMMFLVR